MLGGDDGDVVGVADGDAVGVAVGVSDGDADTGVAVGVSDGDAVIGAPVADTDADEGSEKQHARCRVISSLPSPVSPQDGGSSCKCEY